MGKMQIGLGNIIVDLPITLCAICFLSLCNLDDCVMDNWVAQMCDDIIRKVYARYEPTVCKDA